LAHLFDILERKSIFKKAPRGAFLRGGKFIFYFMSKITEYFKEIKAELKHVVWPSRTQTVYYTIIVVVLSLVIAYFLGLFDFIFLQGLELLF